MPFTNAGENSRRLIFPHSLAARLIITAAAIAIWFWTQSLIGARAVPDSGVGDGIHAVTASANLYLHHHARAANALLIVSSAIIDLLGILLLSAWIFRGDAQPFLGLVIVLGLRQVMQVCTALPAPPGGDLA